MVLYNNHFHCLVKSFNGLIVAFEVDEVKQN